MRKISALGAAFLLSACAYQVQMMPRDSGVIYNGTGKMTGIGRGEVSVTIDGRVYSGTVEQTSSSSSFGLFQTYSSNGQSAFGTASAFGGSNTLIGIMSSPDGHGLRCDLRGDGGGHIGGICLDDNKRVYDLIAHL